MAKGGTITIVNCSGSTQVYCVWMSKPRIESNQYQSPEIQTLVLQTVAASAGETFTFQTLEYFYATVCQATSEHIHDSNVKQSDSRKMQLARKTSSGSMEQGSEVLFWVHDNIPHFGEETRSPRVLIGAFAIKTGDNFTQTLAKQNGWTIGIGTGELPASIFTPVPNAYYSIEPGSKYYVGIGDLPQGAIVDESKMSDIVEVDFEISSGPEIKVIHEATLRSDMGRGDDPGFDMRNL